MKDLPMELWFAILSYLPRSTIKKMYMLNRPLFELAMDAIYEEMYITSVGALCNTSERIQTGRNAGRVRRLHLEFSFLPTVDSSNPLSTLGNFVTSHLSANEDLSMTAKLFPKAVSQCSNLLDVKLIVTDVYLSGTLKSLLKGLWASIGQNVQRLVLNVTLEKLALILPHLTSSPLPLLTCLELAVPSSAAIILQIKIVKVFQDVVLPFLRSVRSQLCTLALKSTHRLDIDLLIDQLPHFPRLDRFLFHWPYFQQSFSSFTSLSQFLDRHPTIKHFSILHLAATATFSRMYEPAYSEWISIDMPDHLPNIQSLELGVQSLIGFGNIAQLPRLAPLANTLRSFTLRDCILDHVQLNKIIQDLTTPSSSSSSATATTTAGGGDHLRPGPLEELSIHIRLFHPETLTLLSTSFPRLTRLDITFTAVVLDVDDMVLLPWAKGYDVDAIRTRFLATSYPNWKVRQLRIAEEWTCGPGHAQEDWMRLVQRCVPSIEKLHLQADCTCPGQQERFSDCV